MRCADTQRDTYVEDFERFLKSGFRFMVVWAIAMTMLAIAGLGWLVFHTDWATYDRLSEPVPAIGAISFALPLLWLYPTGWKRWQRPSALLIASAGTIVRRRSRREIADRRLRGMSWTLILVMAGVAGGGVGLNLLDAWQESRVDATVLLFCSVLLLVLVLAFVLGRCKQVVHDRTGID